MICHQVQKVLSTLENKSKESGVDYQLKNSSNQKKSKTTNENLKIKLIIICFQKLLILQEKIILTERKIDQEKDK